MSNLNLNPNVLKDINSIPHIDDLPYCQIRNGRIDIITRKAYISCGYREVEVEECIKCGGIRNTHLTTEPKQKYQRL